MGPAKGELSGRENDGQCKLKVRWSRQCQQYTESLVYCIVLKTEAMLTESTRQVEGGRCFFLGNLCIGVD